MGIVTTDDKNYKDIAEAIRGKTGKTDLLLPSEMATEISGITGEDETSNWKRPLTWVKLPQIEQDKDVIIQVISINNKGNTYIASYFDAPCTVYFGDKYNTIKNFDTDELITFEYNDSNLPEDTGYDEITQEKQIVVKIVADKGSIKRIRAFKTNDFMEKFQNKLLEFYVYTSSEILAFSEFSWNPCLKNIEVYAPFSSISLRNAFNSDYNLEQCKLKDTSKVTDFSRAFIGDKLLRYIELDCLNCISMSEVFGDCHSLKIINLKNTQKITSYQSSFYNCRVLNNISPLSLKSCKSLLGAFQGATSIRGVEFTDNENLSYELNINSIFRDCGCLIEIKGLRNFTNTIESPLNIDRFCQSCNALQYCRIPIECPTTYEYKPFSFTSKVLRYFDILNLSGNSFDFNGFTLLQKLNFSKNSVGKSSNLSNCKSIDKDELNRFFTECLADLTGQDTQTITITGCGGASECDVTIAQSKNWTVVR